VFAATAITAAPLASEDLKRAFDLREQHQLTEARHLFEQWAAEHPKDGNSMFNVAYTLYLEATAETDAARATDLLKQSRSYLDRARQLGSTDPLLPRLDEIVGKNGEDHTRFPADPAVAALMQRGEKAFTRGDHATALRCYADALALDPHCYTAALFTGDVYFNQQNFQQADEWFAKAVAIDPNRETAHRYWADSLAKQRRFTAARDHYIEAVVAEPGDRIARKMLDRFAGVSNKRRHRINELLPMVGVELKEDGIHLSYNPDEVDTLTVAYGVARARWLTEERSKFFPKDAPPRHSLREEVAGLQTCLAIAREIGGKKNSDAAAWRELQTELGALADAGLLEAFVLIDRADPGIAQDYPDYRAHHRDALIRYIRLSWFNARE
jgi:tetratricopeptide (TPR) repeat protein